MRLFKKFIHTNLTCETPPKNFGMVVHKKTPLHAIKEKGKKKDSKQNGGRNFFSPKTRSCRCFTIERKRPVLHARDSRGVRILEVCEEGRRCLPGENPDLSA